MCQPLDDGRAQGERQRNQRGADDDDARCAGGQFRAPQAVTRSGRLGRDQIDQVTQVACRLRQPPLAKAGIDASLELLHGGPDVVSGQLNLVSGGARFHHVTTVGLATNVAYMFTTSTTAVTANNRTNRAMAMREAIAVGVSLRLGRGSGSERPDVCADSGGVAPGATPPPGSRPGVRAGSGSG